MNIDIVVQSGSAIAATIAAFFTAKAAMAAQKATMIAADRRTYKWGVRIENGNMIIRNNSPYPASEVQISLKAARHLDMPPLTVTAKTVDSFGTVEIATGKIFEHIFTWRNHLSDQDNQAFTSGLGNDQCYGDIGFDGAKSMNPHRDWLIPFDVHISWHTDQGLIFDTATEIVLQMMLSEEGHIHSLRETVF